MKLEKVLPVRLNEDRWVMVMNGYSTFPRSTGLDPNYQMQFRVTVRTLVVEGCFTSPADRTEQKRVKFMLYFSDATRLLSGATTPSKSGPGSDGNEEVLRNLQSSSFSGTSHSDCLVSYSGHLLGWSFPSVEVQSVCNILTLGRAVK